MTGGEDNSHLRRSVLILVHIFRGTQREVRGSYWLKDEPWITKNDWSETGMMRAWVRRRCKLKKMFFEPAMNLRLWQTMEEWGWSAVNLAFFIPTSLDFVWTKQKNFSWLWLQGFQLVPLVEWVAGFQSMHLGLQIIRFEKVCGGCKELSWRNKLCEDISDTATLVATLVAANCIFFFDAMRTHLIFGLMWLHPSWRTQHLDPLVPDHNGPFVSP